MKPMWQNEVAQRSKDISKKIEDALDADAGSEGLTFILDFDFMLQNYCGSSTAKNPKAAENERCYPG